LPGGNNNKLKLVDMHKFKNGFVHLQYNKI
jgi:hypothetical protein